MRLAYPCPRKFATALLALLVVACLTIPGFPLTAHAQERGSQPIQTTVATISKAVANLCEGLVTDKKPRSINPLAKPDFGQLVIDPAFGTRIRRLTNAPAGGIVTPMYSTVQAWNADESLFILYHTGSGKAGHSLYDGKTYRYLKELDIHPADLEQVYWHHSDPDVLFYVDNDFGGKKAMIRYHVSNGRGEAIHYFSCSGMIFADSHGFTSWDSRILGLICRENNKKRFIFSYDLGTNTESPHKPTTTDTAPLAAPSGTLFYHDGKVLDRYMNERQALEVGNPNEHASLGRLPNGHDTYNEVSFDGRYKGSLITHDMTDGTVHVVVGPDTGFPYPPSGTHVSALAYERPGWVAISSVGEPGPERQAGVLEQELYLANADPANPVVCRVAHHRSWGREGHMDYWAEPHVVISPSGSRLLFGSDWGGGPSVDTYVVELPSYNP